MKLKDPFAFTLGRRPKRVASAPIARNFVTVETSDILNRSWPFIFNSLPLAAKLHLFDSMFAENSRYLK
jgi:hypothetical protein